MIASDITRGNSVKIQTIYHISLFMNFLRFYAALNTEDKVKERKEGRAYLIVTSRFVDEKCIVPKVLGIGRSIMSESETESK